MRWWLLALFVYECLDLILSWDSEGVVIDILQVAFVPTLGVAWIFMIRRARRAVALNSFPSIENVSAPHEQSDIV